MSGMRRFALITASLAIIALVAASSRGWAEAKAAGEESAPLTTGRALIDVRTPRLPPLDARHARARRQHALDTSRDRLATVAERNGIHAAARSVPGGFIAVDLAGLPIDRLR